MRLRWNPPVAVAGLVAPQTEWATMLDAGDYNYFRNPGFQFPFRYGHSIAGQAENYGYLGLYWTWGSSSKPDAMLNLAQHF